MKIHSKYFVFWLILSAAILVAFELFVTPLLLKEMGTINILIGIVTALSLSTFLLFGFDKWQAIRGGRRVPEKTLFISTLLGGSIGTLLGMNIFRHKTSKISFQFTVVLIFFLQALIIYGLYYFFA